MVYTPYSGIMSLFKKRASGGDPFGKPKWVPDEDQERVLSYQIFEQIYWGEPDTFKLQQRGSEAMPIYVPSARTIVDTTNRYTANGFGYQFDLAFGTPEEITLARAAFRRLFARERVISKFNAAKRFGIIHGDWIWHVVADPEKPEGSRISIHTVDPGNYFPVYADNDLDRIVKVHLAERFLDPTDNKEKVKRQTYEKLDTGRIVSSIGLYEVDKWAKGDAKALQVLLPPTELPPDITAIPVYHIRNFEQPGNPFGSSEIRGHERLIAAVNQAITDEELALALEGLGMYYTDGGPPKDEAGNITDWVLGPGRVVEVPAERTFGRVTGITSVVPFKDHVELLLRFLHEGSGTPDAAIGKVDVSIAESGISLLLQLGPMLAKVEEKDQSIIDVMVQMLFDLKAWLKAYEGLNIDVTDVVPVLGPKLPVNRKERFDEIMAMWTAEPPLVSAEWVRSELAALGYEFPPDMLDQITEDLDLRRAALRASDPFIERASSELSITETEDNGDRTGNAA